MRNTFVMGLLAVAGLLGCGGEESEPSWDTPDAGVTKQPDAGCSGSGCGPQVGRCPPGMVWISSSTCVDAKEATVLEFLQFIDTLGMACTDPGPTCTACGGKRCFISNVDNPWHYDTTDKSWYIEGQVGISLQHPARYVTHAAAKSACASKGKRLCRADEWTDACGGTNGLKYPYGNAYEAGRCNSASGITGRPWSVGEDPACASASAPQLVDMSGNVWEWTSECYGDDCELRGGSFYVDGSFFPTALSCEGTKSHDQVNETFGTDHDFGYRCCANPLP
jgi:formylglycine-generating enzyme required for sulfatase activity